METIIDDLIDDARAWLPSKDTDQWARPWPNPAARDARCFVTWKAGRTWLVEDGRRSGRDRHVQRQGEPGVDPEKHAYAPPMWPAYRPAGPCGERNPRPSSTRRAHVACAL